MVFVLIKRLHERKGREKEKYCQIALDSHICTLQDYQNYPDNDPRILPQIKPANTRLISARANRVPLGFVGCLKKKIEREERRRVHSKGKSQGRLHSFGITQLKYEESSLDIDFIFLLKKVGVEHKTAPGQIIVVLGFNFLQLLTIREGASAEGRCLGFHSPTPEAWS